MSTKLKLLVSVFLMVGLLCGQTVFAEGRIEQNQVGSLIEPEAPESNEGLLMLEKMPDGSLVRTSRSQEVFGDIHTKGIIGAYYPIANNIDVILGAPKYTGFNLNSSQPISINSGGASGYAVVNTYQSESDGNIYYFEMNSDIRGSYSGSGIKSLKWDLSYSTSVNLLDWSPSNTTTYTSGTPVNVTVEIGLSGKGGSGSVSATFPLGQTKSTVTGYAGPYSNYYSEYNTEGLLKYPNVQDLNSLLLFKINQYTSWRWTWTWTTQTYWI